MKIYKYYFDYDFDNINKTISKLEKSLVISKNYSKEIFSNEGSFYLKDDKYYKKNINYNNYSVENHIDVFDKILSPYKPIIFYRQYENTFFYTKNEVFRIPVDHIFITIEKRNFSIHKDSSTKLVIEFHNNEPKDIYFISNNNIDNISVIEDISYITRMIL